MSVFGREVTAPYFFMFFRMCLSRIARPSAWPMFLRKWELSLYPNPFTFLMISSLDINGSVARQVLIMLFPRIFLASTMRFALVWWKRTPEATSTFLISSSVPEKSNLDCFKFWMALSHARALDWGVSRQKHNSENKCSFPEEGARLNSERRFLRRGLRSLYFCRRGLGWCING